MECFQAASRRAGGDEAGAGGDRGRARRERVAAGRRLRRQE